MRKWNLNWVSQYSIIYIYRLNPDIYSWQFLSGGERSVGYKTFSLVFIYVYMHISHLQITYMQCTRARTNNTYTRRQWRLTTSTNITLWTSHTSLGVSCSLRVNGIGNLGSNSGCCYSFCIIAIDKGIGISLLPQIYESRLYINIRQW